jgi:YgiT-type zinc finger domain-containing protein
MTHKDNVNPAPSGPEPPPSRLAHPNAAPCLRCGNRLREGPVRTAIWKAERLVVVEDIPALICDACFEQYYDDDVADALRRLTQDDLETAVPKRTEVVPVFSLEGRLPPPKPDDEPIQHY